MAIKTSAVKPSGRYSSISQCTAQGDAETVDVLYCVTKPSQSVSKESDIDVQVYKLSSVNSTSETTNHVGELLVSDL